MISGNFWLCATVLALSAAGAYIFFGPSDRPKKQRKGSMLGLPNLGNTCFLNAVIQALVACPSCVLWLVSIAESLKKEAWENYPLIKALISVFKALKGNGELGSVAEVVEALRIHRWLISNEEQDAHEFFHVLTTTIEEELVYDAPVLSLLEATKLKHEEYNTTEFHLKQRTSTPILYKLKNSSPTRGLLASELKCNTCNSKYPTRYDTFNSISLAIPMPHWGQLTLQDLLQKFISCELIQDVSCDVCMKKTEPINENSICFPKLKTTFLKQLSFGKLPKCLCIHIQRTIWLNNGLPIKSYDYILFPEILIMDNYVHFTSKSRKLDGSFLGNHLDGKHANGKTEEVNDTSFPTKTSSNDVRCFQSYSNSTDFTNVKREYSFNFVFLLKAIIVHLGDTSSGHFITYRRGPDSTPNQYKWFRISDSVVKEVPFTEVSQCCAYMLFYEKIN